jgi:phage tail sheath gpL-like
MSSSSIISEPQVNISIISAALRVGNTEQKVLFFGQMLTGSATAGSLVTNIGASGEENDLFGAKSQIAGMIRAARLINKATQFDAIPLEDSGTGVAATGTIVVTGPASESGTLLVTVGSSFNYQFSVSVASGDTATAIGDAIEAAINDSDYVPATANNVTGTVTITASNEGTLGNKIGVQVSGTIAGVGITTTAMSGGANDPSLTSVFDSIDSTRYQTVVWPSTYSKTTIINFMDDRFNTNNILLDGVAITQNTDTYSNIDTAVAALNSKSFVYLANKYVNATAYKGGSMLELDDVVSAQLAAVRSLRLTPGTDLSRYVLSSNGALDTFGGPALASKPYFNTPFPYLPLVSTDNGFSETEMSTLLTDGAGLIGNNSALNAAIASQIPTTYKTNSAGVSDISFKYLEYVDTISNVREYFFNNIKARFAQSRLTQGDAIPGRDMANQQIIEAFLDSIYDELSGADFVLTQAGETARAYFKRNRTVTLDLSDGSATITMSVPIVTQLREITATIQIAFDIND